MSDATKLIGQVIADRYRVDELVGEGGMGSVYRAEHLHMHKRQAVKVLRPTVTGHAEIVERFQREAIAGAHIEHPNVASAIDFGELEDGSHYLVLEYVEGEDLRSVIAQGAMQPARAINIARQIALAMKATHQKGVVHRDLKPENIMLVKRDGEIDFVKVLDFGIAKVPVNELAKHRASNPTPLTKMGMVYGTPEYIAPEQAAGEEVDARADLYAIGVILYEMLCGSRPFDSKDKNALFLMIADVPPPPLGPRIPTWRLPLGLEPLVMRLLEKNPARRTPSAEALVEALSMIDPTREAPSPSPPSVSAQQRASRPMLPSPSSRRPEMPSVSRLSARGSLPSHTSAAAMQVEPDEEPPPLDRFVAGLPPSLRSVPPPALFGGVGFAALLAVLLVAITLRSPQTVDALEVEDDPGAPASSVDTSPAAPPDRAAPKPASAKSDSMATRQELDDATTQGLTALGPLAQRYPTDPGVLKALLLAHASDKAGLVAAMGVAKRIFDVAPEKTADEDIREAIVLAANGTPDASNAAFDVMTTRMGERGPDLLYEIVVSQTAGRMPKERAHNALQDPATRKIATAALLVANELRMASPCQRKALLKRARDDGDARSLPYLKPLTVTTGCGFFRRSDCYGCFGQSRGELREAIDAIESRSDKP